ncbi:MAG: NAD(P)/FAD-dependent oxidoreductase [Verrucomicrobiales bacterium]|nr:NAD(P)/FAD-dependent oxidoreductase [Verrucomicrobiales bacterium]
MSLFTPCGKSAVVIGAGLGGLSAAISLRVKGYDVTLVEKNNHVGGKLNERDVDGFSFDLGPSIFTLPHIFRDLFRRAGKNMEDYLSLERVTPHWRNFFEDGIRLDLYEEPQLMQDELKKLDGDPDKNWNDLQSFLSYARQQYHLIDEGYFRRGLDTLREMLSHYGLLRLAGQFDCRKTMSERIEYHFSDPYLRSVFEYFIKYVGSSAKDAPGYMNMMPVIQYDYGLWYVKGGLYELARALKRLVDELDIELQLGSETKTIERSGDGKMVTKVVVENGEKIEADLVVCNMEAVPAYRYLLRESEGFLNKLERRFSPACSGLVIHVGTDRVYDQLAHHNFFFSADQDGHFDSVFQRGELPEDPTIYLVAPTRTDASKAPEGCDNLKILPHVPPIDPDHPLSNSDYEGFKERVLIKLEKMGLSDLRRHIVVEDTLTPVDIEKMYRSNRGSIYGVVSDWRKNRGFKIPKQSSKYRNLFFTGGSINPGGGMPMAVLCGQKVADRIADAN